MISIELQKVVNAIEKALANNEKQVEIVPSEISIQAIERINNVGFSTVIKDSKLIVSW